MRFTVSKDIDLILIDNNVLQVRYNAHEGCKNISVKGREAPEFYQYLVDIRMNTIQADPSDPFFDLGRKNNIFCETSGSANSSGYSCFLPIKIDDRKYILRVDRKIYLIDAATDEDLIFQINRIARAQIPKEDRLVFEKLLFQPDLIKISPAQIEINPEEVIELWGRIHPNSLNQYACLPQNQSSNLGIRKHHVSNFGLSETSYWTPYINWALEEEIVTSISPENVTLPTSGAKYVQYGYNAAFLLPELSTDKYEFCFGTGAKREEAIGKACLEAVERYFSQMKPESFDATTNDLLEGHRNFREINVFTQYLPEQMEKLCVSNHNREILSWSEIDSYGADTVTIPTAVCYYGHYDRSFEKNFFFGQNSNGCAAHNSRKNAILTGVREYIERDAILLWWYNRISPPQIPLGIIPSKYKDFFSESEIAEYDVRLLNLTLDSLPVVMFIARHKKNCFPYFLCGASCAGTFEEAIEKAFSEFYLAFANWYGSSTQKIPAKEEIRTPLDHELFYLSPDNRDIISFLFEGSEGNFSKIEISGNSTEILKHLKSRFGEILVCDLFSKKINHDHALAIVKVIIPNLIPITFGYFADPLAHKRIYELPMQLGLTKRQITPKELLQNYNPHFFP